ncbi:hypothetical protein ABIC74_003204 [Mucilaginibacter rubeus]|jgi:hypothetical protein
MSDELLQEAAGILIIVNNKALTKDGALLLIKLHLNKQHNKSIT